MLIRRRHDSTLEFFDVEPIEMELLREVIPLVESEEQGALGSRLYPPPAPESETELIQDWTELVQPELRRLFLSARQIVKEDLATVRHARSGHGQFKVKIEHADAWLNTLNQVRLILAEHYQYTEKELSGRKLPRAFDKRELVLVQINFYAAIQERIIELLEQN
jgi:hypothetical protein